MHHPNGLLGVIAHTISELQYVYMCVCVCMFVCVYLLYLWKRGPSRSRPAVSRVRRPGATIQFPLFQRGFSMPFVRLASSPCRIGSSAAL
jgi:hypothetical protein